MAWRSYIDILVPHSHICNGPRPGGHFYPNNVWAVREMVVDHVGRLIDQHVDRCPVCGGDFEQRMLKVENLTAPMAAQDAYPSGPRPAVMCDTCHWWAFIDGKTVIDVTGGNANADPGGHPLR